MKLGMNAVDEKTSSMSNALLSSIKIVLQKADRAVDVRDVKAVRSSLYEAIRLVNRDETPKFPKIELFEFNVF